MSFSSALPAPRSSNVRWVILGLIFVGTTINYIDRQVIGILAPDLQKLYSISDSSYGWITAAFAWAYAAGQLGAGKLLDKFGTRLVYSVALFSWSVCGMITGFARGSASFIFCRALLGVSESPAFPGAAKSVAEWFPRRQRAFAFGFVNAGCNMSAILAPLIVPWLAINYGWQSAFVVTGALGFIVMVFWLWLYHPPEKHPWVSPTELALIQSDSEETSSKLTWWKMFTYPQAWAFAFAKFLTDSTWWFFISWFPKFLAEPPFNLDLKHVGVPLIIIYLMADGGSIFGGWFSSRLIRHGATVNRARKTAFFVCALFVLPIAAAPFVQGKWTVIIILGLATAGHQGFSSNLYTIVSDMFPRRAVASVAGLGGACGYFGAGFFNSFVGYWRQFTGNYYGPFILAGTAYLIALGVIHLLVPRMTPAKLDPVPQA